MRKIEQKKGWVALTKSNTEECGLCDNILLAGRMPLMVEFEAEKRGRSVERYVIELCDECRRLVCTCDICAAFNKEIVEPDEDDEEPTTGDEPEFECFCQTKPDMDETSDEDWCLQWKQARIITEDELAWRLEGRPGPEEDNDSESEGE